MLFRRATALFIAFVTAVLVIAPQAQASQSATHPNIVGNFSYTYTPTLNGGVNVSVSIDRIQNPLAAQASGPLRVELWAFASPFDGSANSGQRFLSATAPAIAAASAAVNITAQAFYGQVQTGTFYPAIVVLEYSATGCATADQYCIVNYETFPKPFISGQANSDSGTAGNAYNLREGSIFSTAQSQSQSFLRFYNTGSVLGTVTVTLRDYASGQSLGQWTSPGIPGGTELQYAIGTLESALPAGAAKPAYYSVSIQSTFAGYFQHVLFRPSDGTLTNLSTCAAGTTADPAKISGVHSSVLGALGFPSSIVVTNSGTAAAAPALGIYDARDGTKLGAYSAGSIPAGAAAVVPVAAIEAAIARPPSGDLYHYVVKLEGPFTGFLQDLVNNTKAGVITDMTAACALDGGVAPAAVSPLSTGAIFSTAQPASQSFLRFFNTGTAAGTVTATLRDSVSGQSLGRWTSGPVPAGAELQVPISTVEAGAGVSGTKPTYYTLQVQSGFPGLFQHVLYRPADGTLTNLSTCAANVTIDPSRLSGVHSALLGSLGFQSQVTVTNTGATAAAPTLGIYDARDGTRIGAYSGAAIPVNGEALISVGAIEAGMGRSPTPGMYHYVVKLEGAFTGFLQHLVYNSQVGVITDMTTACGMAQDSVPAGAASP